VRHRPTTVRLNDCRCLTYNHVPSVSLPLVAICTAMLSRSTQPIAARHCVIAWWMSARTNFEIHNLLAYLSCLQHVKLRTSGLQTAGPSAIWQEFAYRHRYLTSSCKIRRQIDITL
jgi:hypothetical protein